MNRKQHRAAAVFLASLAVCLITMALFVRCTTTPTQPAPLPSPGELPTPIQTPAQSEPSAPLKGWSPDYDAFIKHALPDSLLKYEPTSFCPSYKQKSDEGRREFWAALFKSIAYPESGFNRTERFREPGMTDKQGRQVYSEGLLQLSMQDGENYRTPWCSKLSRANNGSKADTDITRPIFDPHVNLGCGIEIADRLTTRFPNINFADAMGKYWSTIRPAKNKVQAYFKSNFAGFCQ